jgi:hypothetical protein
VALPDNQAERLQCFRNALRNWNYEGYVRFRPLAQDWLRSNLAEYAEREIGWELFEFVQRGGMIDEQEERRAEYVSFGFHYDLRMTIGGRGVYFEPRFPHGEMSNILAEPAGQFGHR